MPSTRMRDAAMRSSVAIACPAVSILNFVIRTAVTEVNLSQNGPRQRWKRPARRDEEGLPRGLGTGVG
jgi:hypothetical protein